jgi:uncharacterized protein (DUF2147 family)
MTNHIFEENPPAAAPQQVGGAKAQIEKQARQLLYDSRYQVRKENKGKKIDPVNMQRMISQKIDASKAIPAIRNRAKQMMNVKEEYTQYMEDSASNLVANALYKVFVEGTKKEESIELDYLNELAENPDKKYKVTVYDPKSDTRYVRYATREKITQLRSKGLRVELTEYGEPRESEAKKGSQTASALGGGGKAKRDYDGDGKVESSSKEHAGAVHNAIQRRTGGTPDGQDTRKTVSASYDLKGNVLDEAGGRHGGGSMVGKPGGPAPRNRNLPGNQERIDANKNGEIDANDFKLLRAKKGKVEEEFLADAADGVTGSKNTSKITGKGVDNSSIVKVFPEDGQEDRAGKSISLNRSNVFAHYETSGEIISETGYSKFLSMVNEKMNLATADMGNVITDFGKSKKKQFRGKSKKKKQQMAIAAKLEAERKAGMREEAEYDDKSKTDKDGMCDDDPRSMKTKVNLVKNKLRAMGLKMSYEPEGSVISERERGDEGQEDNPNNPEVRKHNERVGYRPRPRRPRREDDPRFGTPRDRSGNWKY